MKLSQHADRTEKLVGIRAEDIHKWIDGLFDPESFDVFVKAGKFDGYDPYDHRKFRHCIESLPEAYKEFEGKYSKEQIKAVFECHIKDDYNGYLPTREDFENGTFTEKYHEYEDKKEYDAILSEAELTEYFQGKEKSRKKEKKLTRGFIYRIVLPTAVAVVLFVISVFAVVIPVFRNNMMERKKEMIKELTATAVSVTDFYINAEQEGTLSREQAMLKASKQIRAMRYGEENKDYFWITDDFPKMIMHPYTTELEGKDLTNYTDSKNKSGKKLFVEFVSLVKADNEGYLEYLWQWKDDASQTVPKLSFVRGIPEWNWIIGTGVYINDVEEEINKLTKNLLLVFGFISVGLILILINVVLQSHKIENNKLRAEIGLREAKDRYQALVEASNEGYILEVEGENIFSNLTLQRMLGYSEIEIHDLKILSLLTRVAEVNKTARKLFTDIYAGKTKSAKFEAQIKTKNGMILDVIISTSRIFFSRKNGHVISFREIVHRDADEVLKEHSERSGSWFVSKTAGEICRPISREIEAENVYRIPENTPAYETPAILEKTKFIVITNEDKEDVGILELSDIVKLSAGLPAELLREIAESKSIGHVINTLNRLPLLIREMTSQGSNPTALKQIIGKMFHGAISKFMELSLKTVGDAPVRFSFLSLGSNARHEMTFFSDQDNALIFADVEENELQKTRRYFLNLADGICSKLNSAGYPFCPGGIMAVNPKWCLSLSEWKAQFTDWILNATPESILEVNIFLDIYNAFGDNGLVLELQKHIFDTASQNPQFFIHFASNCLEYKAPLNLLGRIKSESHGDERNTNIKGHLKPLETIARIYAMQNKIVCPGTSERLNELVKSNHKQSEIFKEMIYVFDYLWRIRFTNQLATHSELKKVHDELDLNSLSDIELMNLRNVLSKISDFQTMLNFDFLGGV
jgi:PAS domain S-box-containing protein